MSGAPKGHPAGQEASLEHLHLDITKATESDMFSDEDTAPAWSVEAQSTIGLSIGTQQSRLASPTTPAIEKAAILERDGGFFNRQLDGPVEEEGPNEHDDSVTVYDQSQKPTAASMSTRDSKAVHQPAKHSELPSRGEVRSGRRSTLTSSILDGVFAPRRRASSGPENSSDGGYRSLKDVFTSLPKKFSTHATPPRSESGGQSDDGPGTSTPQTLESRSRSGTASPTNKATTKSSQHVDEFSKPHLHDPFKRDASFVSAPRYGQHARPQSLRRVTSDTSLHQTLSKVSSLGDDSRWDDVSEQVNSRFKAIKDSLQDSKISLPSISSLRISSFTPDFLQRDRNTQHSQNHHNDHYQTKPDDPMTRQPYSNAKAAFADTLGDKANKPHPNFHTALEQLEGDIVILGGYRGSILRSAEPPHRQLWVPIKVGLNLRKVDLEVGIDEGDDELATRAVIPGGMLTHIGPVDISRRLLKRMRTCTNCIDGKLRVHEYGYDWRLHPHYLSKQLTKFLECLPCNSNGAKEGAMVVAHSLGGLITRHAVNKRPELFKGVVYAGVPQTCVNILGPLRNGDEVLLSSRVLTAQVNFTIRTSFALLPLSGKCFIDRTTGGEYLVDFFDPQTWVDYRLSPCVNRPLPSLNLPTKSNSIASYVSNALPSISLPGRNRTQSNAQASTSDSIKSTTAGGAAGPQMTSSSTSSTGFETTSSTVSSDSVAPTVGTTVTMPREAALAYLTRTLATVKRFKQELAHVPAHDASNIYPPISLIYGKSVPTVFGARVDGRDGIKRADAYEDLAFASGDGVVLARAAMAPEGYKVVKGGVVSSERGHVTLLGDLEAVGKCLVAVMRARDRGIGKGEEGRRC